MNSSSLKLRFRLKHFLIFYALVCIVIAYGAYRNHAASSLNQKLRDLGCSLTNTRVDPIGPNWMWGSLPEHCNSRPNGTYHWCIEKTWISVYTPGILDANVKGWRREDFKLLGDLTCLIWVTLVGINLEESGVEWINALDGIRLIYLEFDSFDDEALIALSKLKNIEYLTLYLPAGTDLDKVKKHLTNIAKLDLRYTVSQP